MEILQWKYKADNAHLCNYILFIIICLTFLDIRNNKSQFFSQLFGVSCLTANWNLSRLVILRKKKTRLLGTRHCSIRNATVRAIIWWLWCYSDVIMLMLAINSITCCISALFQRDCAYSLSNNIVDFLPASIASLCSSSYYF